MIVLDASALVDVVLARPAASFVLVAMSGQQVRAPAHQPAEVLSALARLVRAGTLEREDADTAVAGAVRLDQRLVEPSLAHLLRAIALRERIRVLDGLYVALAEELGCPLVTTDRRLAAAQPPCEVLAPR